MVIKQSDSKNLFIMCDYYGWTWGMGIEFINHELKNGRNYEVLDLSFVGELNLKMVIKLFFGGFKMRRDALKYFKLNRIKLINHNFRRIIVNDEHINSVLCSVKIFGSINLLLLIRVCASTSSATKGEIRPSF